jgi:acetolactate synthase-1/2/3 large subunit
VEQRRRHYAAAHAKRTADLAGREAEPKDRITPEYLTACVRRQIGADAIVLNEGITNYPAICDHIAKSAAGTMFASGGGSLGWNGGAAIGAKLANPAATVVALTGDGSYMFSQPSTVHWMARKYQTAVPAGRLQQPRLEGAEILRARRPPRRLRQPRRRHRRELSIPRPTYAAIAVAAGGAHGHTIRNPAKSRTPSPKRCVSYAAKAAAPSSTSGCRRCEDRADRVEAADRAATLRTVFAAYGERYAVGL